MPRSQVGDRCAVERKGRADQGRWTVGGGRKPRNRTMASSSTTLLRVANCGSGTPCSVPGPTARFMNSRAMAEANSLAVSAASAGQRNARGGNCGPPVPRMSISPGRDRGCGIVPSQTAWRPGAELSLRLPHVMNTEWPGASPSGGELAVASPMGAAPPASRSASQAFHAALMTFFAKAGSLSAKVSIW